jgi:hypothetical protein
MGGAKAPPERQDNIPLKDGMKLENRRSSDPVWGERKLPPERQDNRPLKDGLTLNITITSSEGPDGPTDRSPTRNTVIHNINKSGRSGGGTVVLL